MCGIFGFIGRVPAERWEPIFQLLTALAEETEIRGAHATGYAAIDAESFITSKAPMPARAFVRTDAWGALANPQEVVIGHCRYATAGLPKVNANNHPHVGERFALVHNGVLNGHQTIVRSEKVRLSTECDSEVLLRVIEKKRAAVDGIRRLYSSVFAGMQRSAACALLDKRDGALYLFRTNERPLHVVRLPDYDDAVVFASTPEIIAKAMTRVFGSVPVSSDFHALPGRVYVASLNGTARPNLETHDMPRPVYSPAAYAPGRLFDDMFDELRSDAYTAPARPAWADSGWAAYHCTGCGNVVQQRAHLAATCYRCGSQMERLEDVKRCHDCPREIPRTGPSRCPACAEKRNARRKEQRRRQRDERRQGGKRGKRSRVFSY